MSDIKLNAAKARAAELLIRLTAELQTTTMGAAHRKDATEAQVEFERLRDSLFTYQNDEEFEPHEEHITESLNALEKAIDEV